MNTPRRARLRWAGLVLLCAAAWAADPAPNQSDAFLADPLVVGGRRGDVLMKDRRDGRDVGYNELVGDSYMPGSIVVDSLLGLVVSYAAPKPNGPVPPPQVTQADAEPFARGFAERFAPEIFAAGGEVRVERWRTMPSRGYWQFRFVRVALGLELPLRADVGVRGYDGKVVAWSRGVAPEMLRSVVPALRGTAEEAAQAAAQACEQRGVKIAHWLQPVAEVQLVRNPALPAEPTPRAVWVVAGECPPAGLVKVVVAGGAEPPAAGSPVWDVATEGWYLAHGGAALPPPPAGVRFTDQRPMVTPDGRRVLFLSNRPRAGFPAWCVALPGLFMVDLDGSHLRVVAPEAARAALAPDGQSVAWLTPRGVFVRRLDGGEPVRLWALPAAANRGFEPQYCGLAWTPAGVAVQYRERVLLLDPQRPGAPPRPLADPPRRAITMLDMASDGAGRLVLHCTYGLPPVGWLNTSFSLWTLDTAQPDALVQPLVEKCGCDRLPAFVAGRGVFSAIRGGQWLVDTNTRGLTEWPGPVGQGVSEHGEAVTGYTSPIPGGEAVLVTRPTPDRLAIVIWCAPLAGEARPVTTAIADDPPPL